MRIDFNCNKTYLLNIRLITILLAFLISLFSSKVMASDYELCLRETKMNPIFGKGVADKDIDLSIAETACELAIKKFSNDEKINLGLGRIYQKKKVYEKAFSYYKKAYQYGSGDAASAIASLYYRQVIPIDGDPFKKSYEWSSKAVDLGSAEGLWRMGVHYEMGWGVISDFKKALDYYFKSSKSGFSQANIDLGLYYKRGDLGLEKNLQKAKEYFLKEHKLGNPLGSLNLATLNLQESDDLSTVVTSAELIKDLACRLTSNK